MEEAQLLYVTTPVAELGITATPRAVTSVFFRAQPPTAASGRRALARRVKIFIKKPPFSAILCGKQAGYP